MFRDAYRIAEGFTAPVIISRRTIAGECSSSIGAFVVINSDGWIVTAAHILDQFQTLASQAEQANKVTAQKKAILEDAALNEKQKRKEIGKLSYPPKTHTSNCSIWWGSQGESQLVYAAGLPEADLAVGRLEPFDPSSVRNYPVFKDPTKGFDHGTSLLKVGFPFHSIVPTWDEQAGLFVLPPGSLPVPRFPIEGIFTRVAESAARPNGIPARFVETSTPGLRGQSGGPTVDVKGAIWAIQSRTAHLPLGFSPEVPGKPGQNEHQFLNVGLGVHPDTLFAFFKQQNVQFQVSDY